MTGMTDDAPPLQLLVGSSRHGVVQYAADLADAVLQKDERARVISVLGAAQAAERIRGAAWVHVHVTDRLFGRSPEDAADAIERLAAVVALTMTVHDVPQASDGTMLHRRVEAYSRFFGAARAVAVNSRHEQDLALRMLRIDGPPHAIPLGARGASTPAAARAGGPPPHEPRDLIVLIGGYIYPGKGHAQAIRAAAAAAARLRAEGERVGAVVVRAIGAPSDGHERDVDELRAGAEAVGVDFQVTGYLDDAAFGRAIAGDGIPLAAHEHVSASRSMLDWVEAGRRPLVVESAYAAEMAALRPNTLVRYEPAELGSALARAWRHPEDTRAPAGIPLAPTLADVADEYLSWWGAVRP